MKALLAILLFFALAEPAAACRRFSIWHYDFPQPCPIARAEAQAAPAPDIPLPDLSEITWGETGDGRLTANGKNKAAGRAFECGRVGDYEREFSRACAAVRSPVERIGRDSGWRRGNTIRGPEWPQVTRQ